MRHSRWAYYSGVILALFTFALMVQPAAAHNEPGWDKQISGKRRFAVLEQFDGEAVLDKETRLVWEQSPADTDGDGDVDEDDRLSWGEAIRHCMNKNVGGRKGWSLPNIVQLASLVDPNAGAAPFLPARHPFSILSDEYWSATTNHSDPTSAFGLGFMLSTDVISFSKDDSPIFVWCVRGG